MRKLVLLATAAGGLLWWRRRRATAAENALWDEAGAGPVRDLR